MRKPTSKETFVLKGCLDSLAIDVEALATEEPSHDVHGTTRTNLKVMQDILTRLEVES